ncbi:unnamed protein product [Moneuplotes crassus]|uniref:Uncharacterized protein n=1 Tax=Euplotes crassus TaxID=5936 RepID=A0AAD1UEE5_EUPCR|nr:unnamed protein product [Moneuplotes crassus]
MKKFEDSEEQDINDRISNNYDEETEAEKISKELERDIQIYTKNTFKQIKSKKEKQKQKSKNQTPKKESPSDYKTPKKTPQSHKSTKTKPFVPSKFKLLPKTAAKKSKKTPPPSNPKTLQELASKQKHPYSEKASEEQKKSNQKGTKDNRGHLKKPRDISPKTEKLLSKYRKQLNQLIYKNKQKQDQLDHLKSECKIMGISADPTTSLTPSSSSKIYKNIAKSTETISQLESSAKNLEQNTIKLNCEELILNHIKSSCQSHIKIIKHNTEIIKQQLVQHSQLAVADSDKAAADEQDHKIDFIKTNSKQLINLGLAVLDSQREVMKESKVDLIFKKRQILVELEQECQKINKRLNQMNRSSQEERFKHFNVQHQIVEEEEEPMDTNTQISILNKAKMVHLIEEYLRVMENLKISDVDELHHVEQFEVLKMVFLKLCKSNDFPSLPSKMLEEDMTEHSFDDEGCVFIFSLKNFKCLTNHQKDDSKVPKNLPRMGIFNRTLEKKSTTISKESFNKSMAETTNKKTHQCCTVMNAQLNLMKNYSLSSNNQEISSIISKYNSSISMSTQIDSSYKSLTEQIVVKEKEYLTLVGQRNELKHIQDEFDQMGLNLNSLAQEKILKIKEEVIPSELIDDKSQFVLYVEGYFNEIIHQITFKLRKIEDAADVEYPIDIKNLVNMFTTKYEKKLDKKAIVNEIERKLKLEETFVNRTASYSPLSMTKPKSKSNKKNYGSKNKLAIVHKKNLKKSVSIINPKSKPPRSESSKANSIVSTEHDKSVISGLRGHSKTLQKKAYEENPRMFDQYINSNVQESGLNIDLSKIKFKTLVQYMKDVLQMLMASIEDFEQSVKKEREEPTVKEFRNIQNIFNNIENNDEDTQSNRNSRIDDNTKIQEEHVQENQHIEDFRKNLKDYNHPIIKELPPKSKKTLLKPLNRPHSEERVRDHPRTGSLSRGRQGLYNQKLSPLKQSNSTTGVRECRNYIEEENRFIIKWKKQIKNSFVKLKGMDTHKTASTTVSSKHGTGNLKRPVNRDLNKMIAKQVFKFPDE